MTLIIVHWLSWLLIAGFGLLLAVAMQKSGLRWYWLALLAILIFVSRYFGLVDRNIIWGPLGRPEQIVAMYAASWTVKFMSWALGTWHFAFIGVAAAGYRQKSVPHPSSDVVLSSSEPPGT